MASLSGLWLGLTHEMRHVERNFDRVLDQAAERAVLFLPGGLVDEFLHLAAVGEGLLDGVGVEFLVLEQVLELGLRRLGVAVHQVVADDFLAVAVDVGAVLVHVQHKAVLVAHGDGNVAKVFKAGVHCRDVFDLGVKGSDGE